jgi:hypothetical protein
MKKTVQLEKSLMDIVQIVAKTEGKTIGVYITEAMGGPFWNGVTLNSRSQRNEKSPSYLLLGGGISHRTGSNKFRRLLRKMKTELNNFPTYFYRKYYSKFQIDKFLQKQPDKHNLHIETQVDEAIKEFFEESAEPDVRLGAVERG